MSEKYIEYWGLSQHPFQLAPDSRMMYMAGQYYECLERLKYAINTNKGGVLIISEDAGLGKTTILLKLIEEMRDEYGELFRYALVDHPTISSDQLIAHITESISGTRPYDDKLKNLSLLKSSLTDVKSRGGKNIIIVDEGQMLCGAKDVLQELRVLINLTYNNEYLHTFILSGQKPLWDEIKNMPEFWQRLPVRYYFFPLRLEETKELIKYRLLKAGIDNGKEIFTNDAFEIIQRYSRGSPRTIIALADLSLLIGFSDRSQKVSYKEMSKAINAMAGKGESLPYIVEEAKRKSETPLATFSTAVSNDKESRKQSIGYVQKEIKSDFNNISVTNQIRPFFIALAVVFAIIAGSLAGYLYTNRERPDGGQIVVKKELVVAESEKSKPELVENKTVQEKVPEVIVEKPLRYAFVNASAANIRRKPDIMSDRVGIIFEGETVKVIDEAVGSGGGRWYKFYFHGDREGWLSEKVVTLR